MGFFIFVCVHVCMYTDTHGANGTLGKNVLKRQYWKHFTILHSKFYKLRIDLYKLRRNMKEYQLLNINYLDKLVCKRGVAVYEYYSL